MPSPRPTLFRAPRLAACGLALTLLFLAACRTNSAPPGEPVPTDAPPLSTPDAGGSTEPPPENYHDPAGNWALCKTELDVFDAAWPEAPKLVTAHIQTVEEHGVSGRIDIMVLNVELLDGPKGTRWFEGDQSPLYSDRAVLGPECAAPPPALTAPRAPAPAESGCARRGAPCPGW